MGHALARRVVVAFLLAAGGRIRAQHLRAVDMNWPGTVNARPCLATTASVLIEAKGLGIVQSLDLSPDGSTFTVEHCCTL